MSTSTSTSMFDVKNENFLGVLIGKAFQWWELPLNSPSILFEINSNLCVVLQNWQRFCPNVRLFVLGRIGWTIIFTLMKYRLDTSGNNLEIENSPFVLCLLHPQPRCCWHWGQIGCHGHQFRNKFSKSWSSASNQFSITWFISFKINFQNYDNLFQNQFSKFLSLFSNWFFKIMIISLKINFQNHDHQSKTQFSK